MTVSTFEIFQSLLTESVNANTQLGTATKASLLARVADLARQKSLSLDYATAGTVSGFVTKDTLNRALNVGIGAGGTNRVEWTEVTFDSPVKIRGGDAAIGALLREAGAAFVDPGDITMEYRLSSSDAWQKFDAEVYLDSVSKIQFAAAIADQVAALELPRLVVLATQV